MPTTPSPLLISDPTDPRPMGYQPVPRTQGFLPTPEDWMKFIRVKNENRGDKRLILIRDYLRALHQADRDEWRRLSALGQMYFLADHWLKNQHPGSHKDPYPQVHRLFREVADMMCLQLKCAVNTLPSVLEDYWGCLPTFEWFAVDRGIWGNGRKVKPGSQPNVGKYLQRAELEKYRLIFKKGVAWQVPWWRPAPPYDLVRADSRPAACSFPPDSRNAREADPGFAGFVLSMDREFYVAHHYYGDDRKGLYHSAYTRGNPVLCAGTIYMDEGVVRVVKNASGHYMPPVESLTNVLDALVMHGIAAHTVKVVAVAKSWKRRDGSTGQHDVECWGSDFLTKGYQFLEQAGRKDSNDEKKRNPGWKKWQNLS